ncbi:MAG TPA: radical SAM protein [Accumulibacter sp.]|jgi:hypothetical protein|nr:radical SAM protein [Accumulibacter sp.]HQC80689.1 radical SAM protein [Accumulibacter sp.]
MGGNEAIYLRSTIAYCAHCEKTEFARIMARADGVFMERVCPAKGTARVKIAKNAAWYTARMSRPRVVEADGSGKPSQKGCPFDCGPCQWHTGKLHLPVFSITNDCNLDCPICFTYNRPDHKYFKTVAETEQIVDHILARSGGVQLINLTGGEPTLHPDLFAIFDACRREGIGRITMNTNGIKIGGDRRFAERIKDAGVQVVLSLDTLNPTKSLLIHGKDITRAKRKCLENLEALDIPTTILPVCIKGCNEADVLDIVHTHLRKPFVRSITVQNMTFTGANGRQFKPHDHITLDEVEELLAQREGISQSDFFVLSSYHPLCYSASYYIVRDDLLIPLADLLEPEVLAELSAGSYILNPERDLSNEFRAGVNRLWAAGADDRTLAALRAFLAALYPADRVLPASERKALLERWIKMLLIHPHMDSDNFDIDRVSSCGDLVPDEDGRMIPACAYNLLYRQKDSRFWREP